MNLPNLSDYKKQFQLAGLKLPLKPISISSGLLEILPKAETSKTGWPFDEETDANIFNTNTIWPKITIVTPSYNQDAYLEQTIRSVLLQNYPNLEYIIIDGGSTDNSIEIIKKYAPWISFWRSEKDDGQGHAINLGFSIASGNYYSWINSDDFYAKDAIYNVAKTFIKTKVDFVYGYGYNVKDGESELIKTLPLLDYFIKIPTLIQPSTFWSAKIHQPIWEELHCALDFELWLRLAKGQSKKLIKKGLSSANIHFDAKTSDPKMQEKWHQDHLKMWSEDGHGTVYEWKRIVFLNRIRIKIYALLNL